MRGTRKPALELRLNGLFLRCSGGAGQNRPMRMVRSRSCGASGGVALALLLSGLAVHGRAASGVTMDRAVQAGARGDAAAGAAGTRAAQPSGTQVLRVELERDDGRWIYELRLLQPDGRLLKLEVDRRSGEVLEAKPQRERRRHAVVKLLVVEDDAARVAFGAALRAKPATRSTTPTAVTPGTWVRPRPTWWCFDLACRRRRAGAVLQRWRAAGRAMPVLILTMRDGWHEKVAGIDAGADDYPSPNPTRRSCWRLRLRA